MSFVITAHVRKFGGCLRVFEQFARGRFARSVVAQVQAHLFETWIIDVGQGTLPQVRGIQHQHGAYWPRWPIFRQVGQKIHEAFKDLEPGCTGLS